jgi:high-affinity nickel-transport protein
MNEGQRPLSVGFFFSLGHSTIVFALAAIFAIGAKGLGGALTSDGSTLHRTTALAGPMISGSFLLLIGIINLIILVSIVRIFQRMRDGDLNEAELTERLDKRGFMNRFCGRATGAVKKPWQMYLVGLLFGLGFDTATEVALLAAAGAAAAGGLPWYAIMCLPVLFAAGMSLLDTIDGVFMNFAYGWAFSRPIRKIFYNMTITGLSVAVALLIGSIELLSVLADKLSLSGGIWHLVSSLDLNLVGFVIAGMFLATWAIALAVWHFGRIEEHWSISMPES